MGVSRKQVILLGLVAAVVFASLAGLLVLRLFFINYLIVPQEGMFPNIPGGGYILSRRHPYRTIEEVKRGDVVIFNRTVDGKTSKFIWRVIALPGEKVEIARDAVAINGQTLIHKHVRTERNFVIVREWNGETSYEVAYDQNLPEWERNETSVTVAQNHVFVLGDNRYNALDSTVIGTIPFDSIIEKQIY